MADRLFRSTSTTPTTMARRSCFGWIEAVIPIQDKLRAVSRRVLGDVWRVSELTDLTIHHLWQKYRENVGSNPSFRVYATAKRMAHRLEDPGARVHLALNISLDRLKNIGTTP